MTDIVQKTVGSNDLYVIDGSNNTLVVDQTNGRVGINNTNPGYSLTVTGATHTTANLSAGTNLFLVDEGNSRVSIGTTTGVAGFVLNVSGNTILVGTLKLGSTLTHYNNTAPAAGQLLIGDATAGVWDAATLTAGTNITVTNADGAITIAAAGGGGVAIGDAVGASTSGSILFVDSATNLAQDNGELFWDNTNNRLGIGTTSPTAAIQVDSGATSEYAILCTGNDGRLGLTTRYGGIHFNNVEETTDLWQVSERDGAQWDVAFGTPDAGNNVVASNTKLRITSGGNVGIGLGASDPSQKLHVSGTIRQTASTNAVLVSNGNGDIVSAATVADIDYLQPGQAGTDTFNIVPPGAPPDWAGSPPNDIQEAINRLAALLVIVSGGPIP
jgi:trimeric autotransporter adhesin